MKRWIAKNPERRREFSRNFSRRDYAKNLELRREQARQRYWENPELRREMAQRWAAENPERRREISQRLNIEYRAAVLAYRELYGPCEWKDGPAALRMFKVLPAALRAHFGLPADIGGQHDV
jgi:hypothetical protein